MLRRLAAVPAAPFSCATFLVRRRFVDASIALCVAVAARCDVVGVTAARDARSIDRVHLLTANKIHLIIFPFGSKYLDDD